MSGFTMPRGLVAEVDKERYDLIRAAEAANPALAAIRQHRVRLAGGPFDDWAWDVNILPDRFIAESGEYRPTLTTWDDGIYVWFAPARPSVRRWTHALRRPGPNPDRCMAELPDGAEGSIPCECDRPEPYAEGVIDPQLCENCGHELVALGSRPPSDSPVPRR